MTFPVRPRRATQLRETGLVIVSPHGDVSLTPKILTAAELITPYGTVLLTVVGFGLDGALGGIAPTVGAGTIILPLLML